MTRLRLAFMGTPDFAVPSLDALVQAGHEIACVYCQPPRPAGRGQKLQPSPVQRRAEALGLPVRYPISLRKPEPQAEFADLALDAAVVAAYGLILPEPILAAPRLGCVNVHASLLPRWRGAAPIHRAILAGDRETGITIMRMDAGLDTGPMLLVEPIEIGPRATTPAVHDALAALGARLLLPALDGLAAGALEGTPQPTDGVTYAAKIAKEEGRLNFTRQALELDRQVRALGAVPGCWFDSPNGERVKVIEAEPTRGDDEPGTLLDGTGRVACGAGALRLVRVQRPGKAPIDAEAFLRGFPVSIGERLAL